MSATATKSLATQAKEIQQDEDRRESEEVLGIPREHALVLVEESGWTVESISDRRGNYNKYWSPNRDLHWELDEVLRLVMIEAALRIQAKG